MGSPYSLLGRSGGRQDEDTNTTTAISALREHISAFYRLILILIILLIFIGFGIAIIVISVVQIKSCPTANSEYTSLRIIGIYIIVSCILIGIAAIARITFCYHQYTCLSRAFSMLIMMFLLMISLLFIQIASIFREEINVQKNSTMVNQEKSCKHTARTTLISVYISTLIIAFIGSIYTLIFQCKKKLRSQH